MNFTRAPTLPLVFGLLLGGCWDFGIDGTGIDIDRISCTGPERSFDGTWTIRGTGERERCEDDRLDTELFDLRASELVFRTVNDGFFFDREASSVPDSFDVLMTDARSRCVEFTTVESTPRGSVRIEWVASSTPDPDEVEGEFDGDGPGPCRIRGNFRATITPID